MRKLFLFILFFTCLVTTGQAQNYPHFRISETKYGNFYYPKGEIFQKDSLYYFGFLFKDSNFIKPLKKMLQEVLDKEIYQKHDIKDNPILGSIDMLYSGKGKVLRIEFSINKKYLYLFPDKVLWKIYKKIKRMQLKLSPIVGGVSKRFVGRNVPRLKSEEQNRIFPVFGESVKHPEFFPISCNINREVNFGMEHRFKEYYKKKKKNKANKKNNTSGI